MSIILKQQQVVFVADGFNCFSITGNGCVPDVECGDAWEVSGLAAQRLAYWICLCVYFLFQGRYRPCLSLFPRPLLHKLLPEGSGDGGSGGLNVVVYYFQLASLAVPQVAHQGKRKLKDVVSTCICFLGGLLGMRQKCAVAGGGICVARGKGAVMSVAVMAWPLAVPAVLMVLLRVMAVVMRLVSGKGGRAQQSTQTSSVVEVAGNSNNNNDGTWSSWDPATKLDEPKGCSPGRSRRSSYHISVNEPLLLADHHAAGAGTGARSLSSGGPHLNLSGQESVLPAAIELVLFCYTDFVDTTF